MPYTLSPRARPNGVKRFIMEPCDSPVSIWAETLVPAAIKAIWSLLEPDPKEAYHETFGRSALCSVTTTLEESGIADGVLGEDLSRVLFQIAEVVDLSLWYMFLGGIINDFLLEWTSAAYEGLACDPILLQNSYGSDQAFGACGDDGKFVNGFAWNGSTPVGPGAWVPFMEVPPGNTWFIGTSSQGGPIPGESVPFATIIQDNDDGTILDQGTSGILPDLSVTNAISFYRAKNSRGTFKAVQSFSAALVPLPDHECFPKGRQHAFMYNFPGG